MTSSALLQACCVLGSTRWWKANSNDADVCHNKFELMIGYNSVGQKSLSYEKVNDRPNVYNNNISNNSINQ